MSTRVNHPIFARFYARVSRTMEKEGMAEHRRTLLAGLTGEVIEIGAGNGLNFGHYPPGVARVLAVEPDLHLRSLAERQAAQASVAIEVVDGFADSLPAEDASFDAAVVSLVLCSVPDQRKALREIARVVRPGGRLRFLEHVRAETAGLARLQTALDATLWPVFLGGCHCGRDTGTAISEVFSVQTLDRFRFPPTGLQAPSSPHITGSATRI